MRKIVRALILIPLAIVLVAFAVANRQAVTVSFDPFNPAEPAVSLMLPLYALILALVIAGVILGGAAAWMRQGKWRGRAREAEARARELRTENDQLKRRDGPAPAKAPATVDPATRLSIPPPAG
ncbi:MAG: DUF1049 domain-containing protein [Rhizobiales bacterium]|nr:DUF1049 domain-containing protein [Hyphomicrobiales bacterium]